MTHAQEKWQSMGRDYEMTQILESADKYFKASIITMLNKRKYAHDEWTNVTNFIWETETIKMYQMKILEVKTTYLK